MLGCLVAMSSFIAQLSLLHFARKQVFSRLTSARDEALYHEHSPYGMGVIAIISLSTHAIVAAMRQQATKRNTDYFPAGDSDTIRRTTV